MHKTLAIDGLQQQSVAMFILVQFASESYFGKKLRKIELMHQVAGVCLFFSPQFLMGKSPMRVRKAYTCQKLSSRCAS